MLKMNIRKVSVIAFPQENAMLEHERGQEPKHKTHRERDRAEHDKLSKDHEWSVRLEIDALKLEYSVK